MKAAAGDSESGFHSASMLSICLSVCRQNAKKRDFLKNLAI